MQVGVSQLIASKMSMAEFLTESAAAGYEVVELCIRAEGELTTATPPDALRSIKQQAQDAGLKIVSLTLSHCGGNILDSGPAQQTAIDDTIAGLGIADAMDVRCTLRTLDSLRPDLYYDDAYRNAVAAMKQIGAAADKLGVNMAIEFVWNGFLFSPMEMRRFLDEVDQPRIGFYFDPGNMAVFQYPHHWVRIVGKHTMMVHLKDWQGGALKGGGPALLQGEVDYVAMNRELRAIGYDGPMISEVPPADASLKQTADAIRTIIDM